MVLQLGLSMIIPSKEGVCGRSVAMFCEMLVKTVICVSEKV